MRALQFFSVVSVFLLAACGGGGGDGGSVPPPSPDTISATANSTAQSLTVETAMASFSPLLPSGGATPYTYSYTGTLPTGLNFDTSTGVASGTPTAIYATADMIFSVTDANNVVASTTSTVSFTVGAASATISAIANTTAQSLMVGTAMPSFSPLLPSGGAIPYAYSYTGTLPVGLSFSTSTGAVTGAPTAIYATADVVFSVTDANNVVASTTSTVSFTVSSGGGMSGTAAQYRSKNAVNNTWTTLQTDISNPTFTYQNTHTITASSGGVVTVALTAGTPPFTTTSTYTHSIDATGAWVKTDNTGTDVLLPSTFSVGSTWVSRPATASTEAVNATIAAFNVTRTVPAGTFTDCLQVDLTGVDPSGLGYASSYYYSPTAGWLVDANITFFYGGSSGTSSVQLQAGYIANP